jgi:hypothetical protein
MDLLFTHLRERLYTGTDVDERVFIKGDTLYEHPLLTISYTTYDLKRERDPIHLNFGNQAIMVYSPTSQGTEPWLYAHVVAVYHLFVCTQIDPEPKRLELLWVRWMERGSLQLRGENSSQYTRISFIQHSVVPGEAFGFVDPSHIIRACHLIPAFNLGRTRDQLGPSMARDAKGDWKAFYANRYDPHAIFTRMYSFPWCTSRFVDRDAFARFSGIGIGCQQLQATRVLEIIVGPDAPLPSDLVSSEFDDGLFAGCYKIDDDDDIDS